MAKVRLKKKKKKRRGEEKGSGVVVVLGGLREDRESAREIIFNFHLFRFFKYYNKYF